MRLRAVICAFFLIIHCTNAKTFQQTVKTKERLSMNEILGCASDEWIRSAFASTQGELRDANGLMLVVKKSRGEVAINPLPFMTDLDSSSEHTYRLLVDVSSHKTKETKFCRSIVRVHYATVLSVKPQFAEIIFDDARWVFDFAEIFQHADQFTWKAGVYSNSSESYLNVSKANCTMQFDVSTGKPQLSRVLYDTPNSD
jgi:hypothetical protein